MSIGRNIKLLRENAGISQIEFAKMIGVTDKAVSTWENETRTPRMGAIQKIADRFGLDKSDIISDKPMERKGSPALPSNAIPYVRGRRIPILGSIPAGVPVLAVEEYGEYSYADVPEGEDYFFLRVNGDSMINAGINTGDLVLIKIQPCADDGNIVACRVNGDEATLKRFFKNGNIVVLQPENPAYAPVIVPRADFESGEATIIGVAIEVKKKLL